MSPGIQPSEQRIISFLLARFTEVEAGAEDKHDRRDCDLHALYYFGDCSCTYPARVLVECEAKRQLVELARHTLSDFGMDDDAKYVSDKVLRLLARPYADHPDRQGGWKV